MTVEVVKSLFLNLIEPRKVGLLDKSSRGLHEGWGNCLKYLKRGWNKEEGTGKKDFKKEVSWVKGWVP